jgi:hypothetical protein
VSVQSSVTAELEGRSVPGWKRELLLTLAEAMDTSPNASIAKELRSLMDDVGAKPAAVGDVSDDLAAKRAARRSAAG